MGEYVPSRGDIVWLNFDPQSGREQAGRRPAFVLSPSNYNAKTGLMIACPITSKVKVYPFEVVLPEGLGVSGVVLSDQVKSLDWKARQVSRIGQTPNTLILQVLKKISVLMTP